MDLEEPFGNKIFILVGDFWQTCLVIHHGTRRQVVDASIRASPLWDKFTICQLITPVQNASDPQYAAFVDAIGDDASPDIAIVPFLPSVSCPADLTDTVFPNLILTDPEGSVVRSILAPTNAQIDDYNSIILDRLPGHSKTFLAADTLKEVEDVEEGLPEDAGCTLLDYVARRTPPGIPAHSLNVKVGGVYRSCAT
ncbi:hypothetical protein FRB95_012070 [Tulasnella sp. JGI-2019a]|nr:hypothetical protein FRB95_012070 [Tulasnella sp. JGI-2019a]